MKKFRNSYALTALLAIIFLVPAHAVYSHHSYSMFQRDMEKIISGTVVRWAFNNPHSWLYMNVTDADGKVTLWSFEAAAPPQLIGRGVVGSSFEPGNELTLMYCPLLDGRPGGAIGWAQLSDGAYIDPSDGGCDGSAENAERWKGLLAQGITMQQKEQ